MEVAGASVWNDPIMASVLALPHIQFGSRPLSRFGVALTSFLAPLYAEHFVNLSTTGSLNFYGGPFFLAD
jgi:hypothetical protein